MDVSIIIVNYRTLPLLMDAVDSIFEKSEGFAYEIIVVDNHSEDDAEKILSVRYGSRVVFLPLPENMGFGQANNEGAKIARGRNLLFLNPDTLLLNNAIKILSDYLDTHPDTGAAGGNLYTAELLPNPSFGRVRPCLFDEIDRAFFRGFSRMIYGKNILFNHTGHPLRIGYICGADLMIPRKIWIRTGGFDPEFFMYYEETELCRRIEKSGYKIVSVPEAKVIHLEGRSFMQTYARELQLYTSRNLYFRKTRSRLYALLTDANYTFLTALGLTAAYLLNAEGFKLKMKQRLKVLTQARKNVSERTKS